MRKILLGLAVALSASVAISVLATHDGYVCFYTKDALVCVNQARNVITYIES